MSIFKVGALGLCLTGVVSSVVLIIAEHIPAIGLHGVADASKAVLLPGSLCIIVTDVGILNGCRELEGAASAE